MEIRIWTKEDCPDCSETLGYLRDKGLEYESIPSFRMGRGKIGRFVIKQFASQGKRLPVVQIDGEFINPENVRSHLENIITST